MARITRRLTAVRVSGLRKRGLYPDGDGLYLRVTATGTKSWMFRYTRDGVARDMGLGPCVGVSLAHARKLADEARRQVIAGSDPIATRQAQRAETRRASAAKPTFRACAEQFIASHEIGWRNKKHHAQWRATLLAHVYPALGNLTVEEIDTGCVMEVLDPLWRKTPETASRVRGRIEAVLNWAKAREMRTGQNPAQWRGHLDQLLPARAKVRAVRHHPALPYAEMALFMQELRRHDGIAAVALEFLILTAGRTNEVLGARWEEIDIRQSLWTVPGQRMKSGREHRVPLVTRAVELADEMAKVRQNEFVFPGAKQGRPLSNMALLMLLRDMRPGLTVHGFRSTFKDWAAECTSTPNFVSEAALAHVVADKVEAAYRRGHLLEKRRRLMEEWAAFCAHPSPRSGAPLLAAE